MESFYDYITSPFLSTGLSDFEGLIDTDAEATLDELYNNYYGPVAWYGRPDNVTNVWNLWADVTAAQGSADTDMAVSGRSLQRKHVAVLLFDGL